MKRRFIKLAAVLNSIFFLLMTVISIYLMLYVAQFAFEIMFLPASLNLFCEEFIIPVFLYIPDKFMPALFETHMDYLLALFALMGIFLGFNFMCFVYSTKLFGIAKYNDYGFLDEKKKIFRYVICYGVLLLFAGVSAIIMIADISLKAIETKVMLVIAVLELVMILIILLDYVKMRRKYKNG